MGGFSSLIFVMISGSALYYAPYAVGNVPLFVLAVSFVLSFLLLKLYTALSENKTRPFCRLITVLIVPAALIQLGVRLFDFFELCVYSGEKYTGDAFMFLSLAAISFIALYSVHKGGTTPFRTALLSSALPAVFALVFLPIPFRSHSELTGGFAAMRGTGLDEIAADAVTALKCTFYMTCDLAAVYLSVPKCTFNAARRRFGMKGFGGLVGGYVFAAINAEVLRLYYGGSMPDERFVNAALLNTAYSDGNGSSEYGALCLCFFTLTLILRTSLYAILVSRAVLIVKNVAESHKATGFSVRR